MRSQDPESQKTRGKKKKKGRKRKKIEKMRSDRAP